MANPRYANQNPLTVSARISTSRVGIFRMDINKAKVFDLDELLKIQQEERVYRHRCVEGWSMVIPWIGFPLAKLLEKVEPSSQAKYVAFQTLLDSRRMPNQRTSVLGW